jgi:hypothetical protein
MATTWALNRHVSRGVQMLLARRHGLVGGWPLIRWLWLSGAMDGREVPERHLGPAALSRRGVDTGAPVWRVDDGIYN